MCRPRLNAFLPGLGAALERSELREGLLLLLCVRLAQFFHLGDPTVGGRGVRKQGGCRLSTADNGGNHCCCYATVERGPTTARRTASEYRTAREVSRTTTAVTFWIIGNYSNECSGCTGWMQRRHHPTPAPHHPVTPVAAGWQKRQALLYAHPASPRLVSLPVYA